MVKWTIAPFDFEELKASTIPEAKMSEQVVGVPSSELTAESLYWMCSRTSSNEERPCWPPSSLVRGTPYIYMGERSSRHDSMAGAYRALLKR